jgi:serine protease inhibitor
MFLSRRSLLFAGLVVVSSACSDPSGPGPAPARIAALPRPLSSTEQATITASNTFGFNLLREVNPAFAGSNVFLSPLSASMALGMAMNGAVGPTFEEMRTALAFGTATYDEVNQSYQSLIALLRGLDARVDFRIANAIFYRSTFGAAIEPSFLTDARQYFDADVQGLDFASPQAVGAVNDWAKSKTAGKIPKVIDSIGDTMVMLLLNAIYFKGDWRQGFDTGDTHDLPFTTVQGNTVTVPTMHRKGGFRLGAMTDAQVIELPYGGDAFAMTILLPRAGVSVNTFAEGLTPASWSAATSSLTESDLDIYLPKYRLVWEDTLNGALQRLGMRLAFIGDVADFSRLSRSAGPHLYISFVKQNAFVDVNEVGTEAAAVTTVGVGVTSLPPQVRIDRPFVFALRERLSGTILFMGKVVDPSKN